MRILTKWYEKYPKLTSSSFTYENSGRTKNEPILDYDNLGSDWVILGYSKNLPFYTFYDSVGLLFENVKTFETIWFHYVDYIDYKPHVLISPTRELQ